MPDAEHYDQVATRYDGDRLAMWLEDAVDAADEAAEQEAKRGLGKRARDAAAAADAAGVPGGGSVADQVAQAKGA